MTTLTHPLTAQDLLALTDQGPAELIYGELIPMAPAGEPHGRYIFNLTVLVGHFLRHQNLGVGYGAETGFLLSTNPDTVRAPDFAFIRRDRVPPSQPGYCRVAPDLVVEVLSPSDTAEYIDAKIEQWLSFGVHSAWVVNPKTASITVHSPTGIVRFRSADTLTDPVLPGFTLAVADIFR